MTSRRDFLTEASRAALAALALPHPLLARAGVLPSLRGSPVRVRGRVHAAGRGLAQVSVSDGLQVVRTRADGRFELVTTSDRPYVQCSVPAGYALPLQPNGTVAGFTRLAPGRAEQRADFALAPLPGDDATHAFLVVSDPQTQDAFEMGRFADETVPALQRAVAALGSRPAFGVGCGDIMYDDLALYPDYERAVARTGIPFLSVVGNHDLELRRATANEGSTVTFQRHFGPTWRSFDRGEVHYVVLNDVFWHGTGYIGYLTHEQLAWLANDLAFVEKGRTVVLFLHIPLASTRPARTGERFETTGEMVTNRGALYRLLEGYRAHVFSGHTHEHEHVIADGVHEHVVGTSCGAWWSGDICWDGTPNGFLVVEVDGGELRWRYQGTGLAPERRAWVHPVGSDAAAPDELVVNCWDWDPAWTAVLVEGGDRRGLLARRRGLDPRAVREQQGADKPARRSWVEPVPTDHLLYARPTPGATPLIEITDRFGRVTMER